MLYCYTKLISMKKLLSLSKTELKKIISEKNEQRRKSEIRAQTSG